MKQPKTMLDALHRLDRAEGLLCARARQQAKKDLAKVREACDSLRPVTSPMSVPATVASLVLALGAGLGVGLALGAFFDFWQVELHAGFTWSAGAITFLVVLGITARVTMLWRANTHKRRT